MAGGGSREGKLGWRGLRQLQCFLALSPQLEDGIITLALGAGGRDPEHLLTAAKVAPQGACGDLPEVNKGHIGKKTRIQLLSMEKWLDYRSSEVPFRVSERKGGRARFGGKDSKNRHDSSF